MKRNVFGEVWLYSRVSVGLGLAHIEAYYFLYDYLMWHYLLYDLFHNYLLLYYYFFLNYYFLLNHYLTIDVDYLFNRGFLLYYYFDDFLSLENNFRRDFERNEDLFDHHNFLLYLYWNFNDYFFLRVPLYGILAFLNLLNNRSMPVPNIPCTVLLFQAFLALHRLFFNMHEICKSRVSMPRQRMLPSLSLLTLTNLTLLIIDILDNFLFYNNFLLYFFNDLLLYVDRHFHDLFDPLFTGILTTSKRLLLLIDITCLEALTVSELEVALSGI